MYRIIITRNDIYNDSNIVIKNDSVSTKWNLRKNQNFCIVILQFTTSYIRMALTSPSIMFRAKLRRNSRMWIEHESNAAEHDRMWFGRNQQIWRILRRCVERETEAAWTHVLSYTYVLHYPYIIRAAREPSDKLWQETNNEMSVYHIVWQYV